MRITYLHQYFNTPSMSGGTRSYEMARRLVRAGHEVDMITSLRMQEEGGWRVTDEDGIRVHWIPVPYSNRMSAQQRVRAFLRFAVRASLHASSLPGDLVFATSTPLTIAIPGLFAARRRRVPLVFEVRDLWPEGPVALGVLRSPVAIRAARALERAAYNGSERIIALAPGMRDGIIRCGIDPARVSVIPNAADIEVFGADAAKSAGGFRAANEWLGDRPMVLYAGALGTANGIGYLVEVAAAMTAIDPEVRFVVVGDGKERERIAARAAEVGVLDRGFHMLPPRPKNEIVGLMRDTDIGTSLLLDTPALRENSSNKFFDTLAASRPVAVNFGGWLADIVRETGAGLVLPPRDHAAAARHLHEALRDPARLRSMGEAAGRLARERFDRDRLFDQFEAVLQQAVST